jgi:LAO/AO transport system kinase
MERRSVRAADGLIRSFLRGDARACGRLLTMAEDGDPAFRALYDRIYARIGEAFRTGVTGPPGAGKSTLVDRLADHYRRRSRRVGVLAVDPTSPFTGGALLGDRIRMRTASVDAGVFVRSMATRGSLGGLARSAVEACDVLDAFGCQEILVETVGVGQAEADVVSAADTVLVVLQPGAGDGVQAMKAGLMEIGDLFVVNKADLPGADRVAADVEGALELASPRREWRPPVRRASAEKGEGIQEIAADVERHRAFLLETSPGLAAARRAKREHHLRRVLEEALGSMILDEKGYAKVLARSIGARGRGPYAVAEELLDRVRRNLPRARTPRNGR